MMWRKRVTRSVSMFLTVVLMTATTLLVDLEVRSDELNDEISEYESYDAALLSPSEETDGVGDSLAKDASTPDEHLPKPVIPITELDDFSEYTAIHNKDELAAINNNLKGKYYLANDIDLGGEDWIPIGYAGNAKFTGVLDGQGHVISNLESTSSYQGLFNQLQVDELDDTQIKNLIIRNVKIASGGSALAARNTSAPADAPGGNIVIDNIIVSGSVRGLLVGGVFAGGNFQKNCERIRISNCINYADVVGTGAGGVVGNVTAIISGCTNYGSVLGVQSACGIADDNSNGTLDECQNYGEISANASSNSSCSTAGIVCRAIKITNCDNYAEVKQSLNENARYDMSAAGIACLVEGEISNCNNFGDIYSNGELQEYNGHRKIIGGIVARHSGLISNCINEGDITGGGLLSIAGGICAYSGYHNDLSTFKNCTNLGNIVNLTDPEVYANRDKDRHYPCIAGGIIGYALSYNMENCQNEGTIQSDSVVGGIIGDADIGFTKSRHDYEFFIIDSNNYADLIGRNACGGIIGHMSYPEGIVSRCNNEGDLSAIIDENVVPPDMYSDHMKTVAYIGGIIGKLECDGDLTLEECKNCGDIVDEQEIIIGGGIIAYVDDVAAYNDSSISIRSSQNYGRVQGRMSGGVIGKVLSGSKNLQVVLTNLHNYGNVSNGAGIVGVDSSYHSTMTIENCINDGDIAGDYGAGILLYGPEATIRSCSNTGFIQISCKDTDDEEIRGNIGGIAGISKEIIQCSNYGNIVADSQCKDDHFHVGGIAGNSLVSDSYNAGNIRATKAGDDERYLYVGGVAGTSEDIIRSYNVGDVYGGPGLAGIVLTGGIIGNSKRYVSNSASMASVIKADWQASPWSDSRNYAEQSAVGTGSSGDENANNIWRNDSIGDESVNAGKAIAPAQFYNMQPYRDMQWDFDEVWTFAPLGGLPVLKWENLETGPFLKACAAGETHPSITRILSPKGTYSYDSATRTYAFVVDQSDSTIPIRINTSNGTEWELYSEVSCSEESVIANHIVTLDNLSNNSFFVKVWSESETVIYKLNIRRISTSGNRVEQKEVQYDSWLADEGEKDVSMRIKWGWNLLKNSAYTYNSDIAIASLIASRKAEIGQDSVEAFLTDNKHGLQFSNPYSEHYEKAWYQVASPAYTLAYENAIIDGKERNVFCIVVRGTCDDADKLTDIGSINGYFNLSEHYIKSKLEEYMASLPGMSLENLKQQDNIFLITGHSLGGAIANLLAADLSEYAEDNCIFAYTFAAPNTVLASSGHNNIKNIINKEDQVPLIKTTLRARNGKDIPFSRTDTRVSRKIYSAFNTITGGKSLLDAMSQIWYGGPAYLKLIDYSHATDTYLSYLLCRTEADELWT